MSLKPVNTDSREYQLYNLFKTSWEEKWTDKLFIERLKLFTYSNDDNITLPFIEGLCDYRVTSDMRIYALSLIPYVSKQELLIDASKYTDIPLDFIADLIPGNIKWKDLIGKVEDKDLNGILPIEKTYAEHPDWLTDKKYENLTTSSKLIFDESEILRQIKERLDVFDLEDNADVDEDDITSIAKSTMDMVCDNYNYIQMYGPVNGRQTCLDGKNCHMFTCKCNTDDEKFNGECDGCGLGIKSYRHCLKIPLQSHGWSGWYHNYSCLIDNCVDLSLAEIAKLKMMNSIINTYKILEKLN
jgi:hypothetical protein